MSEDIVPAARNRPPPSIREIELFGIILGLSRFSLDLYRSISILAEEANSNAAKKHLKAIQPRFEEFMKLISEWTGPTDGA